MKPLQPSEKRLALILGSLVVVVGSIFLLKHGLDAKDRFLKQKLLLKAQLQQARILTQDAEGWTQRQQWLSSRMPVLADDATAKLTEDVLQKAKNFHVKISRQKLLEPAIQNGYREVSIQVEAQSSMENMIQWFSDVEQFNEFRYFKKLDLKRDEKGDMIANVVVAIRGKAAP
jgi:hypothetical protein